MAAKGIDYESVYIDLSEKGQTNNEGHWSWKNPMQQVPVLDFIDSESGGQRVRLTQSLAIIEFLESAFANQGGQLLPLDPVARAKVKEVAEIINSGTQPLQSLTVQSSVEKVGGEGSGMKFGQLAIEKGLQSLEELLAPYHHGTTSETDNDACPLFAIGTYGPTLADICIVPQMYNCRRFGVDCSMYPTLLRIEETCKNHIWFQGAEPELQPDYPE